jgi:hypothetical protein
VEYNKDSLVCDFPTDTIRNGISKSAMLSMAITKGISGEFGDGSQTE